MRVHDLDWLHQSNVDEKSFRNKGKGLYEFIFWTIKLEYTCSLFIHLTIHM